MSTDISRLSARLDLLYLVTREFNASLDINNVLHNVISATVAAVGASDACLFLFDAAGNLENSLLISNFEVQKPNQETLARSDLISQVRTHKQGLVVSNTETPISQRLTEADTELFKAGSAICVPIQLLDQADGVLMVTSPQPDQFDEADLTLLTVIAGQAAIAITNARLFATEQKRRRLADTLTSITQTINATLDLDEVLILILEQLRLVVDYDSSSILLCEEEGHTLAVRAARGFTDMDDALNVKINFDEDSPNYRAILQKRPLVIDDVDTEPHWIKSSSSQDVRSWIGAPLIARDEVVGILTVDSHDVAKYTEENAAVVAAFANQAATAVANAQAVTRLQNAEATYVTLFEDSTDMIFITNYEGFILDINRKACQMLRRHKDIFIHNSVTFIAPHLKDFLEQQTKRLKLWREASIELEVKDAYRQSLPLEIKVRQMQYKGKDVVEWVGRDISARKEIERMRQDMVNMLIHDLRGPLGNLINIIDLIAMMLKSGNHLEGSKLINFLEMGKRSGQAIKDLVDSILDVSRLEQGEVPLQRSMTNLGELILAVQEQILPQAEAKNIEITIYPIPATAQVWLDSNLIRRILINLMSNAVKYTQSGGRVNLITTLTPTQLYFAVSDDGPGISKEYQNRIFNKFSRVDYSANAPSGVGLGLAFCKLAAQAHNGVISVESEGIPGKGTTFHLTIPVIQPIGMPGAKL